MAVLSVHGMHDCTVYIDSFGDVYCLVATNDLSAKKVDIINLIRVTTYTLSKNMKKNISPREHFNYKINNYISLLCQRNFLIAKMCQILDKYIRFHDNYTVKIQPNYRI